MLNHLKVTYSNTTPDNAEFMANCIMQGAKHLKIKMRETISQSKDGNIEAVKVTEIKLDDASPIITKSIAVQQTAATIQRINEKNTPVLKEQSYDFVGVAG